MLNLAKARHRWSSLVGSHQTLLSLSSTTNSINTTNSRRKNEVDSIIIYRWPTMKHFRLISRLKIYQVSTMLALLPSVTYWYSIGDLSAYAFGCGCTACLGTTGILVFLSNYFSQLAGQLAYNPTKNTLKISTLTFWGKRRELEFPVERVVGFVESQTRMGGAIQRLEIQGHGEVFLWSLRYGRVLNLELLCKVLRISDTDLSYF